MNSDKNKDRLFSNLSIYVDKIPVQSPLLKDIYELGEEKYLTYLGLCISKQEAIGEKYAEYESLFFAMCDFCDDNSITTEFLNALKFFTGLDFLRDIVNNDTVFYAVEEEEVIMLHRYNFMDFQNAVKIANGLQTEKEPKKKTKHEKLVEEAKKKIEQKLGKKLEDTEDDAKMRDWISGLCVSPNSYNLLNVWDLTLYQFLDQLKRSQLYEKYHLDIMSLLAGADSDSIDINHYMLNLDKDF